MVTSVNISLNILLAEDDICLAEVVKLTLERKGGHKVTVVNDGAEALMVALQGNYDVIILDYLMPQKNGLEVCQAYRAQSSRVTPIVLLSAKSDPSDVCAALTAGINSCVAKPFCADDLCAKIIEVYLQTHV